MLILDGLSPGDHAHLAAALRAHRLLVGTAQVPADLLQLERAASRAATNGLEQTSAGGEAPTSGTVPVELYTTDQVAEALNLSARQVGRLLADGTVKAVRIGRSRRVRRTDLEAYIAALESTPC